MDEGNGIEMGFDFNLDQPSWSIDWIYNTEAVTSIRIESFQAAYTGIYKINGHHLALNAGDIVRLNCYGIPFIYTP